MIRRFRIETELAPQEALDAVREVAEAWDLEWQADGFGGRLQIPIVAGLRRGRCEGRIQARATDFGSEMTFEQEKDFTRLNWGAVGILGLGGVAGIAAMVAPFFWHQNPRLITLIPIAGILTLVAWFLVVSKLTSSGPEEFLRAAISPAETALTESAPEDRESTDT